MNVGDNAREAENRAVPARGMNGVLLFSMAALFCYAALVGEAVAHLEYWQRRYVVIHALLLGMVYATAMICALRRRWCAVGVAVGMAAGVASFFAVSLGTSINPLEIVAALFLTVLSLLTVNFIFLLVLGGFVASNILLMRSCARHTTWHRRETKLAFIGTLILAVGTGPLTGGIRKYEAAQAQVIRDEGRHVPARIYGLQACLVRFAQASSHGYPASLGEINPVLPGCVSERLAAGEAIDGFRYRYLRSTDSRGRQHFTLSADGVRSVGILHIAFASDDTFVLRRTDEANTPAARGGSLVFPAEFELFLSSIRNYAVLKEGYEAGQKQQGGPAPAPLDSMELNYPATLAISRPAGYFPASTELHDDNSFADAAYRYSYERIAGPPETFRLSARPKQYGVTGLLSFYVDNSGIVHVTAEDRGATAHDPVAPQCTYDGMTSHCENPQELAGGTSAIDIAQLFRSDRPGSTNNSQYPGGLATGESPKLFWRTPGRNPRVLGMSDDFQFIYAVDEVTGISALRTADASPVWTLADGINGITGPNEFYALSDRDGTTVLQRIDASGEIAWRFSATGAKSVVRAANGMLYVSGGYLWAIDENGRLVWRMELQDTYPAMPELSADGKTLYVVSTTHLFAVDTEKGRLHWRVDNSCNYLLPECSPKPLADGTVAIESVELDRTDAQSMRTGPHYQLRLLDAEGKTLWTRNDKSTIDYVVPPATSLLVVRTNFGLEFVAAGGKTQRKEPGRWGWLRVTRQPSLFFAGAQDGGVAAFATDGRQELNISTDKLEDTMCLGVPDGRGDLLFLESRDIYDRYSLWSVRFP